FLYRLNSKLLKSHSFYFQQLDSSYSFVLDGVDTILLKENSFAINSLYKLEGIEKFKLDLKLKGLENLVITNDKQERTHNDKKKIISELIDKIELKIMISKLQYNLTFTKPDISINKFRNIEY
ncbi:MAG: hypothetical protein KKE09_03720, partial [Bacteroidetes bacterium]|nr:hypothetical protein [Bacteroidota bacterium]